MSAPDEHDQTDGESGHEGDIVERDLILREAERELTMFRTRQELRVLERGALNPLVLQIEALLQRMEQILRQERSQLGRLRRQQPRQRR